MRNIKPNVGRVQAKAFAKCFFPSSYTAMCSKVISGVVKEEVHRVEDALEWLECGNAARVTSATEMNIHSSQSHAVFTVSMNKH